MILISKLQFVNFKKFLADWDPQNTMRQKAIIWGKRL